MLREKLEKLYMWLIPKAEWTAVMLGILGLVILAIKIYLTVTSPAESSKYRYSSLPKKCVCPKCGYEIENPGKHCYEIRCPRCGTPMRRKA